MPMNDTIPEPFNDKTIKALRDLREDSEPQLKIAAAFGGWNLDTGLSLAAAEGSMEALAQKFVDFANNTKL